MGRAADAWARATPAQRASLRRRADARREDRRAHPLAYARLWDREEPRTSQRRAVGAMLDASVLLGFLLGGNRSGKSEALAQILVAAALGRQHPDVQRWCALNGVSLPVEWAGPAEVWHSALDSGDSRRYGRPKVARYVPEGATWRNRDGPGEAEVTMPGGGKVTFKSADQGRDGYQGASVRAIGNDEEPPREVVGEQMMRVADQPAGRVLFAMTPLMGWTALLEEYVRTPAADVVVRWLHGSDNPHVPVDRLLRILAKYGQHERAARERGEIVALEGRVYPAWRRDLHLVPPRQIPPDWPLYVAVDFGTRNPTAILWAAHDERDDVLHLYRLRYEREKPQEWHVAQYLRASGAVQRDGDWCVPDGAELARIEWVVADPSGKAERLTWLQAGVMTVPAPKHPGSVREQINATATRLEPDAEGRPHLVVYDTPDLAPLVREIESYVWKPRTGGASDLPDEPLKKDDHAMDALAYLCLRLQRLRGAGVSPDEAEEAA